MVNFDRTSIHLISSYSNWSEQGVARALKDHVYNDISSWKDFLRILFVALGIGFSTAGIIFFFAYNWADPHKFVKIGIMEGLVVITTLIVVLTSWKQMVKNIILTGTTFLVGGMIAVFGQIYQTGANAYDFFLGWTMFVTLWVIITGFAPLWLTYLTLINTTLILYSQQVAHDWSMVFVCTLLFSFNAIVLFAFIWLSKYKVLIVVPTWFTNLIALAAICFSTIGVIVGIFEKHQDFLWLLILVATICYIAEVIYGLKTKSRFYLSIVAFSVIVIINGVLIKSSSKEGMMLFVTLFNIVSVTLVIYQLIAIQKKWDHETRAGN